MDKYVVTGATGLIGTQLVSKLLENDCFVYAIIRPESINKNRIIQHDNLQIIELGIEDYCLLYKYIPVSVDGIFHLAWEGGRGSSRNDKDIQYKNYICSIDLMISAIKLGVNVFIGSGSQAEYGKCTGKIDENYTTSPITEYGKYKLKTYETLKNLSQENNIKFIWPRIFSVYGKYDFDNTLIMSSLKKLSKNENLQLTECRQDWDFIHVKDAVDALYLLGLSNCIAGIYNIASGYSRPLREFVIDLKRITNSSSKLDFGAIEYGSEGIVSFNPSVLKLKTNTTWTCNISFEEGILELYQYIIQNEKILN